MNNGNTGIQAGTRKPRWREDEDRVLRDGYKTLGPEGCAALLPGRPAPSCKQRAHRLGYNVGRVARAPAKPKPTRPANPTPVPAHDAHADAFLACQAVSVPAFAIGNLVARL